jgi:hypothetical protein
MPIENAKLPDQDIPNWIKTLREGGFTDEELDSMLPRLNKEYSKASGIDPIEQELQKIEKTLVKKHGRTLTEEQRKYMRESIGTRPEFKDFNK